MSQKKALLEYLSLLCRTKQALLENLSLLCPTKQALLDITCHFYVPPSRPCWYLPFFSSLFISAIFDYKFSWSATYLPRVFKRKDVWKEQDSPIASNDIITCEKIMSFLLQKRCLGETWLESQIHVNIFLAIEFLSKIPKTWNYHFLRSVPGQEIILWDFSNLLKLWFFGMPLDSLWP